MGGLKSSFTLKKYKENEYLVELTLNFGYKEFDPIKQKNKYKPLRYYTGVVVNLSEWDKKNKTPINQNKQNKLQTIKQTAYDIFNFLETSKIIITPELLKLEMDNVLKGKEIPNKINIEIANYIENVLIKENHKSKKNKRAELTLKKFKVLQMKIESFEELKGVKMTIHNLNENLYLDFVDYLRSKVNRINPVWDMTKLLKAVLNEISRTYKVKTFNPSQELSKKDNVRSVNEEKTYMNFDHIQKVISYKPKNERLQNTKLILITLLFTGCRYSDVFKIQPEHEYNKEGIKFRYARFLDKKTDKDIIIPFLKPLEDSIKENNGMLPYQISDVKFNKYVKELSELAKLNEEITLSFTNSYGKKEYEVKKFFQFVTSHIGRRSFITNLINYVPVTILSKITGHALTNKNVIFSYNKISLIDNTVLFVKELKRVTKSNPKEFPIKLIEFQNHKEN